LLCLSLFPYTTLFRSVGIVSDVARARRRQRQEICAKRAFVGSAIGPKGPPRLPIRPQAFVVRHSVLDDERLDALRMGQGHAKTRSEEHTSELQSPYDL